MKKLATNLQNKAPKPVTYNNADDVSDVTENTGSTRTSKAAKMTDEVLIAVKKDHQLAFKEQADSFAVQMKELETLKAQIRQLQEQPTQHPSPNHLTPERRSVL